MIFQIMRWGIPLTIALIAASKIFFERRMQHRNEYQYPEPKCEICQRNLDDERKRNMLCGHTFHASCIGVVIADQVHPSCPVRTCRIDF